MTGATTVTKATEAEVAPSTPGKEIKEKEKEKHPDILTLEDLREFSQQIEKSTNIKDASLTTRVLRNFAVTRRRLNHQVVYAMIKGFLGSLPELAKQTIISAVGEPMMTDELQSLLSSNVRLRSYKLSTPLSKTILLPEVEVYIELLVLVFLLDAKKYEQALTFASFMKDRSSAFNRRTLDRLSAKFYFYYSRAYELSDKLEDIRGQLHDWLRTATLRNDCNGQAVLINLLLRNYLHYNLYDQADKLRKRSHFPEAVPNNEWARYTYYLGRIKAINLEYTEAHTNLLQALRKAGQHSGVGFRQTVQKLAIIVELLLGDIPDRSTFRQAEMRRSLQPYFLLTQAVRSGNLGRFTEVLERFRSNFISDHTLTLIIRLRHNVIKTGVRMINLSYSRIKLADIAAKLQLDSAEDAEFICAKAIRDGVIEATIKHEEGYMQSKEKIDIYSTSEPMNVYHQRIKFCLEIHHQSVKAMRYPDKKYGDELDTAEERREREQQELESAKEMAESDDFDF